MKTIIPFQLPLLAAASLAVSSPAHASPVLAQVAPDLKTGVQSALGIMFLFGFIWGVVNIWGGAQKLRHGDTDGKMGIVSGIIIAGASAIMTALFAIFGLSGGSLTPQF